MSKQKAYVKINYIYLNIVYMKHIFEENMFEPFVLKGLLYRFLLLALNIINIISKLDISLLPYLSLYA